MAPETLENFRINLWDAPEVRSSVPLEASWSYPIPVIKEGQVRLRFLLYTQESAPEKPTIKFYPPYKYVEATIGADPKVVVTRIRKPEEHTQPLGESPPPGIRGFSYEKCEQLDEEFNSVTEKMLPFVGKRELARQEADNVRKYRELFALLVEPELQKEYRKISPEFFQWLDKVQP